ncbi:MAG: zonular occludens toxin domain-containing protein [Pseudomonadota bacterium]|nr:zonular occludens toxin domain-containing protein [Pseudomonadota bacterium]
MITLITGTPGSGKTLYAVSLILKYADANKKLLEDGKEPRYIYSDIDGLNIRSLAKV